MNVKEAANTSTSNNLVHVLDPLQQFLLLVSFEFKIYFPSFHFIFIACEWLYVHYFCLTSLASDRPKKLYVIWQTFKWQFDQIRQPFECSLSEEIGTVAGADPENFSRGGPTLSKIDSVWCITLEVHKYEK